MTPRDRPSSPDVPVFTYHNAIPGELERDLRFLTDNNYQTLTASQVVDVLTGHLEPPERPVALTFDDALLTVLTFGLPLFERFESLVTVFAITGLTDEGSLTPRGYDEDRYRPMGWEDLRRLRDSGLVEIGAHGHRHNPVHVEDTPGPPVDLDDCRRAYDVPVPYEEKVSAQAVASAAGTPARPAKPLLAADRVLVDGRRVDAEPLIRRDLETARRLLNDRLGADRLHLCLPYGAGRPDLPEIAAAAGFESVFWSRRDDRTENRPGDDPYRIVRRKHDWLRRLPGRGRRSLAGIMTQKVARRLRGDPFE